MEYNREALVPSLNSWVKFRLFHFLLLLDGEPIVLNPAESQTAAAVSV